MRSALCLSEAIIRMQSFIIRSANYPSLVEEEEEEECHPPTCCHPPSTTLLALFLDGAIECIPCTASIYTHTPSKQPPHPAKKWACRSNERYAKERSKIYDDVMSCHVMSSPLLEMQSCRLVLPGWHHDGAVVRCLLWERNTIGTVLGTFLPLPVDLTWSNTRWQLLCTCKKLYCYV